MWCITFLGLINLIHRLTSWDLNSQLTLTSILFWGLTRPLFGGPTIRAFSLELNSVFDQQPMMVKSPNVLRSPWMIHLRFFEGKERGKQVRQEARVSGAFLLERESGRTFFIEPAFSLFPLSDQSPLASNAHSHIMVGCWFRGKSIFFSARRVSISLFDRNVQFSPFVSTHESHWLTTSDRPFWPSTLSSRALAAERKREREKDRNKNERKTSFRSSNIAGHQRVAMVVRSESEKQQVRFVGSNPAVCRSVSLTSSETSGRNSRSLVSPWCGKFWPSLGMDESKSEERGAARCRTGQRRAEIWLFSEPHYQRKRPQTNKFTLREGKQKKEADPFLRNWSLVKWSIHLRETWTDNSRGKKARG